MVHLHLHTHIGSILDGIGKPSEYAELAKKYNHFACGITDHGRMGGILTFQKEMIKQDIKPLLGVEMYISDNLFSTNDDTGKRTRTKNSHIILYAGSELGYKNLLKLNWLSMQDDHFYYMPRIIHEELKLYSNDIIVGTACIGSKIGRLLFDNKEDLAENIFKEYLDIFKDRLYAEIQLNELEIQKTYNDFIIKISNKYGVPLCITGDVHYAKKEDVELQTLSIMINRKQTIDDMGKEDFFDIEAKNLYYTNEDDIFLFNKNFKYNYKEDFIKECLNNTDYIANKINYTIPGRTKFYVPSFENKEQLFQEKIKNGIKKRFSNNGFNEEYKSRLKKEYEIIKEANLIDYFLIVEDYHDYAINKLNDFAGIGRGSAAGSLISYLLGITTLDPLKHDLIFERFLTKERAKKDFPDIDSDFSQEVKPKIEEYLINKYGSNRVFHICTYTVLGLKSAAKDLCRVYKIDYTKSNEFTKELDNDKSWQENLDILKVEKPHIYKFYLENKKVLDLTPRFDGLTRNMGVHAGGIIILSENIDEIIPVDRVSGVIVSAFQESGSNTELDSVGIVKLDILGIKTLGVINEAINLIIPVGKVLIEYEDGTKELLDEHKLG